MIDPHFADHVTGMLAENCCVFPCDVAAETGVITIGDTTVKLAVAFPLELVAVTVQVVWGRAAP